MPGILEINAIEYYANEDVDDVENGIVNGLVIEIINPNDEEVENTILGETFIKPFKTYTYEFNGSLITDWHFDRKDLPIDYTIEDYRITIKWKASYSGQFVLSYGNYNKTIVIESLF